MRTPRGLPSPVAAVVAAALLLSGCVGLPDEGPVVESDVTETRDDQRASDIDARAPQGGASRAEVVTGFLEAMTAWPVQTSVAKEYLTDESASQWNPEQEMVIYADASPASEVGGIVSVELTSADRLDDTGGWQGSLPRDELDLEFRVTVEDGEYRIVDPPDALVVPATWFQQRYRQVSLYYFDPNAQILVPEPVFVPAGEQLATTLVSALLAGPPSRVHGVVRTFLPQGLSVGLSVPVDDDGVAEVDLVGDAPRTSPEETELLLAQLAWTLRQDSDIRAFRVTMAGDDLPLPGGASTYSVDAAQAFDPSGAGTTGQLYGLSEGRLVHGSRGALTPVEGPLGEQRASLVSASVRPDAERVAVVDRDGRRVRVGRLGGDPAPTVLGGVSVARPSWDHAGRLWLLDRRPGGAVVWCVERGRARKVEVPGVTGTRARFLLVSRDGTRLVAVVGTASGDEVVGARVMIGSGGRVVRTTGGFPIRAAEGTRISDIAWASPVRVALLTPTAPGSLHEVDIVSADGATVGVDALSTIVAGNVLGIAGKPDEDSPVYAVYANRYVDVVTQDDYDAGSVTLTQLDYAG